MQASQRTTSIGTMHADDNPRIFRSIPAVTDAMKQAGAEILAGEMPAEELVVAIYQAMALELAVVGTGDRL